MQDTRVQSLGWEDPLEKEMATYSSTLAWRIPWGLKELQGGAAGFGGLCLPPIREQARNALKMSDSPLIRVGRLELAG